MAKYYGPWGDITVTTVGAGEGFIADELSGQVILPPGVSGDIITLTPPLGSRVRLTQIYATGVVPGVTVTVGGVAVANSLSIGAISTQMAAGDLKIGNCVPSASGNDVSTSSVVTKNSNDTIVITKDSGSTGASIFYQYEYGD